MMRSLLISLLCGLLLMGCTKSRCWKSAGSLGSEKREMPYFESLYIEDDVDVRIVQDSPHLVDPDLPITTEHMVTVHAGEHLREHIITEVIDGTLHISNNNTCNFLRSYEQSMSVTVFVPYLHTIDFRGSGKVINTEFLQCDSMRIDLNDASGDLILHFDADWSHCKIHTGPGNVTLRGSTGNHFAYSTGNGFIDCSQLRTPIASAVNFGTGDISVFASEILSAEISHTGWVKYSGNPDTVHSKVTGSGLLIQQ